MLTNANLKKNRIFRCKQCDYFSNRKNNLKRHFETDVHKMLINANSKKNKPTLERSEKKRAQNPATRCRGRAKSKTCSLSEHDHDCRSEKKTAEKKIPTICRERVSVKKCLPSEHDHTSKVIFSEQKKKPDSLVSKKTCSLGEQATSTLHVWCKFCNKKYKHSSSLSRHQNKCLGRAKKTTPQKQHNELLIYENVKLRGINDYLIEKLENMNSNINELKDTVTNMVMVQNITNEKMTNLGNISVINNNKMSIHVYLNNECKNAMNLTDFLNEINISLEDLLYTKNHGYVKGIGKIFEKGLLDLEPTKRPIHCSDKKRLQFYIKDADKWKKDSDHMKIDKSIQYITHKQIKKIKEWECKNPHYLKDEKLLLEWHMMVQAIMGGSEDHEKEKNNEKIKKNLIQSMAK